jgi:hypothetical protein
MAYQEPGDLCTTALHPLVGNGVDQALPATDE